MNMNMGNWNAVVKNNGKIKWIAVDGTFPTNGEKPVFELVKIYPQGIYTTELMLSLTFGVVVDPNGTSVGKPIQIYVEYLTEEQVYETVSVWIIDKQNNFAKIADIEVVSESHDIQDSTSDNADNSFTPYLEVIKGFEFAENKLWLRVPSGGLTTKENIRVEVNKGFTGLPPFILLVYRIKPDFGKANLPDGVVLEYELSELQIQPGDELSVKNFFCITNNLLQ
jgi:hypothetical protein